MVIGPPPEHGPTPAWKESPLLTALDPAPAVVEDVVPGGTWPALLVLAAAAVLAYLLAVGIGWLLGRFARRAPVVDDLRRRGRRPLRLLFVLLAVLTVLNAASDVGPWRDIVVRVLGLALIATVGWLIAVSAFVVEDLALARYDVGVVDNRRARRVRTQVSLLRRLTVVAIGVLAVAAMLLTFPAARSAGTSLLASAGVISIVAGLAAQTSLANVFAGLQLAFTDALRGDDVIVVEEEWGRVEEITLTYVVLHLWDDRRLVLPSTYFTTTPFQNWTRTESAILGSVEFDLDWSVPFDAMRAEFERLLAGNPLWNGRVQVLQVTDAVGSFVRVRVLVSAKDGPTLFDLRCHVREGLVSWLQHEHPQALPKVRTEGMPGVMTAAPGAPVTRQVPEPAIGPPTAGLFTGSPEARERSRAFQGPAEEEQAQREESREG